MKIFLISGKAGSGKNEVANLIKKYLPKTVVTSFSKYIKLFALEMTDWDGRDLNKPRTFLQETGDKLRAIDTFFLPKRMYEDLNFYKIYFDNVVIADVRLINEINYFKDKEYLDVYVIRVNFNNSKRNLSNEEKNHHTELELDNYNNYDYVINNDGEDLENKVKDMLEGMK